MQTKIVPFFMVQNAKLQAKLLKSVRFRSQYGLSLVVQCKLLKIICEVVWDAYLLETSLLVTKTPLTTLKCLGRKYIEHRNINNSWVSDVKKKILRTSKDIKDSLLRSLNETVLVIGT